jgi:hypothetical protein
MLHRLTVSVALTILLSFAPGCGSDDSHKSAPPDDETEAGDGKIHPPPNGTHVSETEACEALLTAQEAKIKALTCSITTRTCPALLRAVFITQCMEYDDGSVQGCIAHYKQQVTCDGLSTAIDECLVTPYPGTEPKGCPTP